MENTQIIKVDPKEIVQLSEKGGELMFKKTAEASLVRLLELQRMVNEALDRAKLQIVEAALKLNPNFKGIEGEEVKITFRNYGEKYEYDWKLKEALEPFLVKKEYFKVDSKKVDEYVDTVGELPEGITEKDRSKTPSIKFIGDSDD